MKKISAAIMLMLSLAFSCVTTDAEAIGRAQSANLPESMEAVAESASERKTVIIVISDRDGVVVIIIGETTN